MSSIYNQAVKYFLITGSAGLIGSECSEFFIKKGFKVLGLDNNSRKKFFGVSGSVDVRKDQLNEMNDYLHFDVDIRNKKKVEEIFIEFNKKISCVIHCAAQPSHDWAVKDKILDYEINSTSTLQLLDLFKIYCPDACFINVSTNKVYGDNPNKLDFTEKKHRYEVKSTSKFFKNGIDESMSTDNCVHSFFGVSKLSADLYVQEFGKNLKLNTVTFRGGCLTGENHSGVELHGFLSYLVKCIIKNKKYNIYGYKGKQVRDNIHSSDLINCFWHYYQNPKEGEIYNIGGGRENSCSILEVLKFFEKEYNVKSSFEIFDENRVGDHIWWITDYSKFSKHFPQWKIKYKIEDILTKIANFEIEKS